MRLNKGTIQLSTTTAMAAVAFIVSPIAAFFGAKESLNEDIYLNSIHISEHTVQIQNIDSRLERIENKLDSLLEKNGIIFRVASSTNYD